jgi:hypothetical protein
MTFASCLLAIFVVNILGGWWVFAEIKRYEYF